MNFGLKDTFEFHVQKRLSRVDGYTQVWQCIGPSIEALALLILVHAEEGSGFSLDDVAAEGVELGLVSRGRVSEVMGMLRQEGLLAGGDDAPRVGVLGQRLVAGLDANYPNMAGIVLPAYMAQLLQELLDGRNELEKALDQVDQALNPREKEDASIPLEDPAMVEARRDRFLKQIATIRWRLMDKMDRDPAVQEVTASVSKGAVRTLVVSPEELSAPLSYDPEHSLQPRPEMAKPSLKISSEESQREAFLELQREKMELAREREAFLREKKSLEEERNRSGLQANLSINHGKEAMGALTRGESDEEIAKAVARFEEGLSLGCPVCHTGTLEVRTTDNGKSFFRCDNRSCGFVTWKRPYPFACPVCKNPFLVENDDGDGLLCPRSVCSFKQKGLEAPQEKRRVRKVRRVVRKKR